MHPLEEGGDKLPEDAVAVQHAEEQRAGVRLLGPGGVVGVAGQSCQKHQRTDEQQIQSPPIDLPPAETHMMMASWFFLAML